MIFFDGEMCVGPGPSIPPEEWRHPPISRGYETETP